MRKLCILVDMDGTIEDILSVWVKRANQKFHRDVKKEEITNWDVVKAYPGIPKKEVLGILNDGSIWSEVKPIEGAAEAIKSFIDDGHKVYIVTASNYETLPQKMDDLLFQNFPFISWYDVIVTHNKQMLKADVLIDDAVHNMIGGSYAKILLDAPYNRDVDDKKNDIVRVKNWKEIKKEIIRLSRDQK